MRILHVYSGNLFGGIESILVALARGRRVRPGLDHEFALAFHDRLERELIEAGARVHPLGAVRMSRPTTARSARAVLADLLRRSTCDRVVCHAAWAQAIFGGVARRANVPLVFWAHDAMRGRHWTERLARRVVPDLVICNSRFTATTLHTIYPRTPSEVLYAPVEFRGGPIDASIRNRVRLTLDTPERAIVIAQASRSERWKGHEVLIDALAALRDNPDWIWWQIGGAQRPAETAYLESLQRAARRRGIADRVRWLGERDDVPELLASADIYCQPNLAPEPFGVAYVEALGAGLPVVASRLGGACEIVDESCGALVEPRNPLALAAALRTLIDDAAIRGRLAAAAPARARDLCDPAGQLRRLETLLYEMTPAGVV